VKIKNNFSSSMS